MADVKISALPPAGSLDGTEIVPVVDAGATKKTTVADIVGQVDLSNYQGNTTLIQSDTSGSFRATDGLADVQVSTGGVASITGTTQVTVGSSGGSAFVTADEIHVVANGGASRVDLDAVDGTVVTDTSQINLVAPSILINGSPLVTGVTELWVSGANFQGTGNGFENPLGAGDYVAYDFPLGFNRYAITEIAIPAGWNSFSVTYYITNNGDSNLSNNYVFESSYQLAGQGTVLSPTGTSHPQTFSNAGINTLVVGVATPNITVSGAKLLNYLIRSNNATQGISATVSLIGLLLTKVS